MARTFDPALTGQQSSPCLTEDLGFVMMVRLLSFHVDYCRFILFHPAICIKLSCPFLDILCVVHVDQKCPSWLDNYTDWAYVSVQRGHYTRPSNGHVRITVFFPVWSPLGWKVYSDILIREHRALWTLKAVLHDVDVVFGPTGDPIMAPSIQLGKTKRLKPRRSKAFWCFTYKSRLPTYHLVYWIYDL